MNEFITREGDVLELSPEPVSVTAVSETGARIETAGPRIPDGLTAGSYSLEAHMPDGQVVSARLRVVPALDNV